MAGARCHQDHPRHAGHGVPPSGRRPVGVAAWLALQGGKLVILKTPNGENPLVHGATPILGVDVWEHSYYLDFRNRRPDYLQNWVDRLANYEFAEAQLKAA